MRDYSWKPRARDLGTRGEAPAEHAGKRRAVAGVERAWHPWGMPMCARPSAVLGTLLLTLCAGRALAQAAPPTPTPAPATPAAAEQPPSLSPSPSLEQAPAPAPSTTPESAPVVPPPPPEAPVVPPAPVYPAPGGASGEAGPGYYGRYEAPSDYGAAPGAPQARPTRTTALREHDGFFLRLTMGLGIGFTQYDEPVNGFEVSDVTTRGLTSQFSLSAGGRVVDNLIVHGDLLIGNLYDADKKVDGSRDDFYRIDGSLWLLGAGATYYFMPSNVYVTAVAGVAGLAEGRDNELAFSSGAGFGTSLLLGKEWWVGAGEWGIGAAVRGTYVLAPVEIAGADGTIHGQDISVVFSSTFN